MRKAEVDFALDFFDRPAYLTVSGQLEAETFACGLGKTYTFGPTFRAENSNTPRHLAEFWMIEPEVAFCDLWGDMELAEGLLKRIFARRAGKMPGGHAVLQRADRQDGPGDAPARPRERVPPRLLHRGGRDPEQARASRSSFPPPGATTSRPNTSDTSPRSISGSR